MIFIEHNMQTAIETEFRSQRRTGRRGVYSHLFSEYAGDESIAEEYWKQLGCQVERLDVINKRYPDFAIRFPHGSLAVCEVKSFGGPETGVTDYDLDYNSNQRLSNALYSGISQLLEYEGSPTAYRILFFVNHNDRLAFDEMVRLLDGEWDPFSLQFRDTPNESSSQARAMRREVDLYMWLRDTKLSSGKSPSQHWGKLDNVGELCKALNLDPPQLRMIKAA